jgi:rhodanese-related sulfurtransferase
VAVSCWNALLHRNEKSGKIGEHHRSHPDDQSGNALILDIREQKEFSQGHIAGAYNLPASVFDKKLSELDRYKTHPVVVVCKMGTSAGSIAKTLKKRGFEQVVRLAGGMSEWHSFARCRSKRESHRDRGGDVHHWDLSVLRHGQADLLMIWTCRIEKFVWINILKVVKK